MTNYIASDQIYVLKFCALSSFVRVFNKQVYSHLEIFVW